ncbi:transcriptional regulator [Chryseobacterium sp. Leaf405]|uniref:MFS transporter n=1 Tax=Chryseobacterium sp. Leaf405 TaxID=1736367 RepID=UPI0006FC265C|nr:MFS transporter [Chryseobacterium sp. Leaf405]KQT35642.1 transcriptional regulator [Chryseobacterium sp. Leaf405]
MKELTQEKESVRWGGVWAMSLCAMVLVASEFLPVSLLTPIASDLQITEGYAGQTIAISGLFALVTSLFLTSLIGNIDRRRVLLFFTFITLLSGIIVAAAPNAGLMMIGRALLGICIGGFWSMSTATSMRLVPEQSVPKAIALLNGGVALSSTVAAPLGSYLGGVIGWRGAFICIVPIAVIALIWQRISLPKLPAATSIRDKKPILNVMKLLTKPVIAFGMISVMLLFVGQFSVFTYLRPFLETVTKVSTEMLSMILLTLGVAGLVGTFLIEHFMKERMYVTLIVMPILMMLTVILLLLFGSSVIAIFILIPVWGLISTAAPTAWWIWLSKTLPDEAEAGGGLMVAIMQLSVTLGAGVGGLIFDHSGFEKTFLFSAFILMAAAIIAFLTWRQSTFIAKIYK